MHTLVKQILLLSPDQQIDLIGEIFGSEFNVEIVRKLPDVASLEKTFQDNPYLIVVAGEGSEPGIVEAFLDESEDSSLKVLFFLALIAPNSQENLAWENLKNRSLRTLVLTQTNAELSQAFRESLGEAASGAANVQSSGEIDHELDETIALLENYQPSRNENKSIHEKQDPHDGHSKNSKIGSAEEQVHLSLGSDELLNLDNLPENLTQSSFSSPQEHLESLLEELGNLQSSFEGVDFKQAIVEDVGIATITQKKVKKARGSEAAPEKQVGSKFDDGFLMADPIESRLEKLDEGALEADDLEDLSEDFGQEVAKEGIKKNQSKSSSREVYPEKRRRDDPYLKIVVSSNLLEAKLILYPHETEVHGVEDVKAEMDKQGIIYGIDSSKIDKCLRLANERREPVLGEIIARGKSPVEGQDARIDFEFELDPILNLVEDEDGRIDYRDVYQIACVEAGDLLATLQPPVEPEDGISVFGETVIGKTGKESRVVAAKNVRYDEKEMKFFAEISGQPCLKGVKLTVLPVYTVPHDVDYSTGNIDFLGTVVVSANVTSGFRVRASEDIRVMGVVEAAELHAGGEIYIKRGFMGASKGKIQAKKRIVLRHASSAKIVSEEDLLVEDSLLNCDVISKGKVRVVNGKGSIIGGIIRGVGGIECINLGTEIGTPTQLIIGEHFLIRQMLNEVNQSLSQKKIFLKKLGEGIQVLSSSEDADISAKVSKLKETETLIEGQLKSLQENKDGLLENFKKKCLSRILVRSFAYPGVWIFTGSANMKIVDKAIYCSFHEDPDRVAVKLSAFERREIEKKK